MPTTLEVGIRGEAEPNAITIACSLASDEACEQLQRWTKAASHALEAANKLYYPGAEPAEPTHKANIMHIDHVHNGSEVGVGLFYVNMATSSSALVDEL